MLDFLDRNKEWIFSGIGITVLGLLVFLGRKVLSSLSGNKPTIKVTAAIAGGGTMTAPVDFLVISVQNRTDRMLYLGNIFLELVTREQFMPTLDRLTRQGQQNRQLQPGASFSFHILASDIIGSGIPLDAFKCAAVRDAVDRVYRSSQAELQKVLNLIARVPKK